MTRRQEVVKDKISYLTPHPPTGGEVSAEMDAGENSTQGCLFGGVRESRERALYPGMTSEVTRKSK